MTGRYLGRPIEQSFREVISLEAAAKEGVFYGYASHNTKDRVSPFEVEVRLIEKTVFLPKNILCNNVRAGSEISCCHIDRLSCLFMLFKSLTGLLNLGSYV